MLCSFIFTYSLRNITVSIVKGPHFKIVCDRAKFKMPTSIFNQFKPTHYCTSLLFLNNWHFFIIGTFYLISKMELQLFLLILFLFVAEKCITARPRRPCTYVADPKAYCLKTSVKNMSISFTQQYSCFFLNRQNGILQLKKI